MFAVVGINQTHKFIIKTRIYHEDVEPFLLSKKNWLIWKYLIWLIWKFVDSCPEKANAVMGEGKDACPAERTQLTGEGTIGFAMNSPGLKNKSPVVNL